MAAVTVVSVQDNVAGSYRERYFTINIASSGDTLQTGLHNIVELNTNTTAISLMAPGTGANIGLVTFTTTGAVTGALFSVTGQ